MNQVMKSLQRQGMIGRLVDTGGNGNHSGPSKSIQAPSLIPWPRWFAVQDAELPELSDSIFRVWIVLNFISARNRYGHFQVSDRRLAVICNVHPRTIRRRIARLVEFQLIAADRSSGRIGKYKILPIADFKDFQKWRQRFKVEKPKKERKKTPSLEEEGPTTTACPRS